MLQTPDTTAPTSLEVRLIQIAQGIPKRTKKACVEALRAAGLPGRNEYAEWMLNRLSRHEHWHKVRHLRRAQRRIANLERLPASKRSRVPVLLPQGDLKQRLNALRTAAVIAAAKGSMRWGAAGGSCFSIRFCHPEEPASYEVTITHNWDTYSGAFKGWRANEDTHHIKVPSQWLTRVERKGLAHLDGLLTLDAAHVTTENGCEVFQATWARQGRGYQVITEHGYIAHSGDLSFHAASTEAAIAGLLRKRRASERARVANTGKNAIDVAAFIKRYRRVPCEVTLDDARDSGSCEPGILGWCQAVGIDSSRQRISMSEALAAFKKIPAPEARLAILHAVKRHKSQSGAEL